jgi:RNA polymerase sigma-70 factor (ECF subfamily)
VQRDRDNADGVDRVFRRESGRAVATLVRQFGDLELADECVQDAFLIALERWPLDGIPDNPGAWVTAVARNRAIDSIRRTARGDEKVKALADGEAREPGGPGEWPTTPVDEEFNDDRLRLIMMCCHPALATEAQVALTLNLVVGLKSETIARAFLVPKPTMVKRLVRAKRKIREARIPFSIPTEPNELENRVSSVQAVIYLIFNEGYSASEGDSPIRAELCDEAIWLARLLRILRSDDASVAALLALLLLQDSRRAARVDAEGRSVLLADQDRSLWDDEKIEDGLALLAEAGERGEVGVYALQAGIAALHVTASTADQTDWESIALIYQRLAELTPSPVLEVNRAVAVGMADGPAAGLEVLDQIKPPLDEFAPSHLVRADLSARAGAVDDAIESYRRALELIDNKAQRAQIEAALADLLK